MTSEIPYAGLHYDWGGTRAGRIGATVSFVSVEGAAAVPQLHTSAVQHNVWPKMVLQHGRSALPQ